MGSLVRLVAAHIFPAMVPLLAIIFQVVGISQVKRDDIGLISMSLKA